MTAALIVMFVLADFSISTAAEDQQLPVAVYTDTHFCVLWQDMRHFPGDRSLYAARVTQDGLVLDQEGKLLFRDQVVVLDAAFDGVNMLVAFQDSC
jgi:hypothetical protein